MLSAIYINYENFERTMDIIADKIRQPKEEFSSDILQILNLSDKGKFFLFVHDHRGWTYTAWLPTTFFQTWKVISMVNHWFYVEHYKT